MKLRITIPNIRKIKVEEAIGLHLAHDITIIGKDKKTVLFKKGHVIKEEDIEPLKRTGKFFVYVSEELEELKKFVHEDEVTSRIAKLSIGDHLTISDPFEGKVKILSEIKGLLKINTQGLEKLNKVFGVKFATLKNNTPVEKNQVVAYVGFGPLFAPKEDLSKAEKIAKEEKPILEVLPYHDLKIGLIVTGTEIFEGLIEDKFTEVLEDKLKKFDAKISLREILPDNKNLIKEKIIEFINAGCELIIVSGGMSVDPDDQTPFAIQETGAKIEFYGAPFYPGSSVMLAYYNEVPVYGTTASPIFYDWSTLDLFIPRFLAKDKIKREEIVKLGEGGLQVYNPKK